MREFKEFLCIAAMIMISYSPFAQRWNKVYEDTNCLFIHTTTIAGNKYIAFFKGQTLFLLSAKGDTLIKKTGFCNDVEFKDFNKDGFKDVVLQNSSNGTMALDLFLYLPKSGQFRQVKNFENFPEPEPIGRTKYYYSYHKSGCADMNWDSDLFYIDNFRAIRIGNISGRQCDNSNGVKDAVYIYKQINNTKKLFKTLPIDTISKYKDFKWGFIADYWTKNYRLFL